MKPKPTFLNPTGDYLNDFLIRLSIEGQIFEGMLQVQRAFRLSTEEVIKRLNDNVNFPDWQFDLPQKVYLVGTKVFYSQGSVFRHSDFTGLSLSAVKNRFKSKNFPDWQIKTKEEFLQFKKENPLFVFEFMWQRSNDHPFKE